MMHLGPEDPLLSALWPTQTCSSSGVSLAAFFSPSDAGQLVPSRHQNQFACERDRGKWGLTDGMKAHLSSSRNPDQKKELPFIKRIPKWRSVIRGRRLGGFACRRPSDTSTRGDPSLVCVCDRGFGGPQGTDRKLDLEAKQSPRGEASHAAAPDIKCNPGEELWKWTMKWSSAQKQILPIEWHRACVASLDLSLETAQQLCVWFPCVCLCLHTSVICGTHGLGRWPPACRVMICRCSTLIRLWYGCDAVVLAALQRLSLASLKRPGGKRARRDVKAFASPPHGRSTAACRM